MGTVFLAQHPVIGSKVALKAIHPEYARSPEVVSRFVNEARAVNQIGHDHIIDIHDFGTTPAGDFYFIMEYLNGEMLSDQRGRQVVFSPARALNIVAQIADALAASHERGVIHRDLKPDNIFLITRDGEAGLREGARLRAGEADHREWRRPGLHHRRRNRHGDAVLHVARAVRGASGARPQDRRLLPGRHPVRDADRPGPLRRRGIWRGDDEAHLAAAARRPEVRSGSSDRARGDPQPSSGQGSRRALSDDGGVPRGAAQHRERPRTAPGARRERDGRDPSGPLPLGAAISPPTPAAFSFQQHVGEVGEAIDVRPRRSRGGIALSWRRRGARGRRHGERRRSRAGDPALRAHRGAQETGHRAGELQLRSGWGHRLEERRLRVGGDAAVGGDSVQRQAGRLSPRRRTGTASKVSSFVPNLPSPVFVLLERLQPPAPAPAADVRASRRALRLGPSTASPAPARARASRESRQRLSAERYRDLVDDGDDVMPPSTQ